MVGDELYTEIAFHHCEPCDVQSGPSDPTCWNCGGAMKPHCAAEDGHYLLAWEIGSMKTNHVDYYLQDGVQL